MSQYQCEAWQIEAEDGEEDHLMQVEDSSLCPVFSIEIFATFVSDGPTIMQQLLVLQNQLTQAAAATTFWSAISSRLGQMHVPFSLHATVIQKIIECARSAVNETHNKNRKNIPIAVRLVEEEALLSEELYDQALAESFDLQVFRVKGASKGAIEAMEKLVDVEGFRGRCVICLEEISDGMKSSSRMPCSHVYHQDCIVRWLGKSNLCPLCRFQMPTELDLR